MGDRSCLFGCTFEGDKAKGVAKRTQTAFVDLLVERFDVQYESLTPASVEFDPGAEGKWREKAIGLTSRRLVGFLGSQG